MTEAAPVANCQLPIANCPPLSASEAARLLAVSTRRVRQICERGELTAERDAAGRWAIDPDAHPAFRLARGLAAGPVIVSEDQPELSELAHLSEAKRSELHGRVELMEAYLADQARRPEGQTLTAFRPAWLRIWNVQHPDRKLSVRTLRRHLKAYAAGGIVAVADGRDYHGAAIKDERAWKLFCELWLDESRPYVPRLHELVAAEADRRGWDWPSVRTVQRWVAEELDPKQITFGREPKKYRDRHRPYVKRGWSKINAMQLWVADHRQLDLFWPRHEWVKDKRQPDGGRWRWCWKRPWLTLFLDARSWRPVCSTIAFDSPNGNRVMGTFAAGVREHGLPEVLYLDNGKDFRMGRFSGGRWKPARKGEKIVTGTHLKDVDSMLTTLGVEVTWALPYEARSKIVEPFFKLVAEWFDKLQPTYCGNREDRRPLGLHRRLKGRAAEHAAAVLDEDSMRQVAYGDGGQAVRDRLVLEPLRRAFDGWLTGDYCLRKSPSKWCGDLSAERAFHELRSRDFVARKPADQDVALLGFPSKPVVVTANGIFVKDFGREYWNDCLADLAGASGRDKRRKITYRWNPADPTLIWVFDRSGKFLCTAEPTPGRGGVHPLARLAGDADDGDALAAALAHQKRQVRREAAARRATTAAAGEVRLEWARRSAAELGKLDTAAPPEAGPAVIPLAGEISRAAQAGRRTKADAARQRTTRRRLEEFLGARTGTDDSDVPAGGACPSALDILADGAAPRAATRGDQGQGRPEEHSHAGQLDDPA